jgi:hypothetical protein
VSAVDTERPALPLTGSLLTMLNVSARCRGVLKVAGRTAAGIGRVNASIPLAAAPLRHLPPALLGWLEEEYALRVSAAVWQEHGAPISLPSLWAVWHIPAEFADGPGGWKWRPSEAGVRAAADALAAFPLTPPIVIDGYVSLTALWPLTVPMAADQGALDLLRRLAARLGAEQGALDAMLSVPGGIVRNVGAAAPVVTFARLVPEQYVAVEELEVALHSDTEPVTSAPTRGRKNP